jgi:outer membrane biosynthesis protein TonB
MFLAAGGALVLLKNARQNADLHVDHVDHVDQDQQDAPKPPNENSEVGEAVPTIEPLPPAAPVTAAVPNKADDDTDAVKALATGSGTATTTGSEGEKAGVAGEVESPQNVIARMGPDFRRCYNSGLATNPAMKGSLRVTARIGPDGKVVVANASDGNGLSQEVIACVTRRVKSAQFAPPDGGGATIVVPVSFVGQ